MKILTNKQYLAMMEQIRHYKQEAERWRQDYKDASESYFRELETLSEIKETKLLASKYDYVICCKDYNCSIYIDGKREKKVKEAHFDVSACEVPRFTITR